MIHTPNLLKAVLIAFVAVLSAQDSSGQQMHYLNIKNAKQLQVFFKYTGYKKPIISGHRGGMIKGFPENSIAAFENTLRYTPAFYEIDPRFSKDSVVVLMHDATLDRTTNGKGKVSDYTYAQLKELRLKDVEGNLTDFKIPTLADAIMWSKGKTVLNLDKKDVPLALTARILKDLDNEVVMVTVHNAEQAKFYYQDNPDRMMSAFVKTKEAFDEYEAAGIPWRNIIAYVGPLNTRENKLLYDLLHGKGVMCMISAAPKYDKLEDPAQRAKHYRETFIQGADILETDLPIEAAEAIKTLAKPKGAKKNSAL